jgi:hypothetical protein
MFHHVVLEEDRNISETYAASIFRVKVSAVNLYRLQGSGHSHSEKGSGIFPNNFICFLC